MNYGAYLLLGLLTAAFLVAIAGVLHYAWSLVRILGWAKPTADRRGHAITRWTRDAGDALAGAFLVLLAAAALVTAVLAWGLVL